MTNIDRFAYEEDTATVKCPICGDITTVKVIDDGIGDYEYWGAKGVHQKFVLVTTCCHEEVTKEELND